MTISSVLRRAGPFNGNGSTTVFAREFMVLDADHLKVYQTIADVTTEVTSGISKDGIGTAAGNVTFSIAPATGTKITLLREIPLVQETDYSNQAKVEPERVEDDFDLQEMKMQEISETLGRTLRLPITSLLTNLAIPDPVSGKTIIGNAAGDGFETGPTSAQIAGANASAVAAAASASAASAFAMEPYASRAAAIAATIPATVTRILVYSPDGETLAFVSNPVGTALTTEGARTWSPDGVGSPYHFGAVLDGDLDAAVTSATNDAAALALFWAWLASGNGRAGHLPGGKTARSDSLVTSLSGDYTLTGGPIKFDARNLPNADGDGVGSFLNHSGSPAATVAISSITAVVDGNGKEIVTVVTSAAHNVAVGDDIKLSSDDLVDIGYNALETRGQMSRVRSVTNATTFIIEEQLFQTLTTNPVLTTYNWLENILWDCDMTVYGPGRRAGSATNSAIIGYSGPSFTFGRNIQINGLTTKFFDYQSLVFDSCIDYGSDGWHGEVDRVDNPNNTGAIQYGITDKNACTRGHHNDWSSVGYRHAYDSTSNSNPGVGRDVLIENYNIVGTNRGAIAMHGSAFNCRVGSGKINNCYDGIDVRAPGWTISGKIEMERVRSMVLLSDNAFATQIRGLRGKDVRRVVALADTNILIGIPEFGELDIADVSVDGCALNAIDIDTTSIPILTQGDSAAQSGTTTSMVTGDLNLFTMVVSGSHAFDKYETITQATTGATAYVNNVSGSNLVVHRVTGTFNTTDTLTGSVSGASGENPTSITTITNYNATGMLTSAELTIGPAGGAEIVRTITSHVYNAVANTNTFTWTTAAYTAVTTAANYDIRTLIDGVKITDINIRNGLGRAVQLAGNFRKPVIRDIDDNSDSTSTLAPVWLRAVGGNFIRSAELRDITTRNRVGPQIDADNTGTRIDGDFVDRATAVEYISDGFIADGEHFFAGDFAFVGKAAATNIADMDGVVPRGDVTPDHWTENVTPGTTDMQAALVAAVTYCNANGLALHGSADYKSTATILNFHDVQKVGTGAVVTATQTVKFVPQVLDTDTIYVATTGDDLSDGFEPSRALASIDQAFDVIRSFDSYVEATWTIDVAAGVYTETVATAGLFCKDRIITLQGPTVSHPSLPTVSIAAPNPTDRGLSLGVGMRLKIENIKFTGFSEGQAINNNGGIANLINVHTAACSRGVINLHGGQVQFTGGVFDGTGASASVRAIGYSGYYNATHGSGATSASEGTIFQNFAEDGVQVGEGTQGHLDYFIVQDNGTGIDFKRGCGAPNTKGMTVRRNGIGVKVHNSMWYDNGIVFGTGADVNTINVDLRGSAPELQRQTTDNYMKTMRYDAGQQIVSTQTLASTGVLQDFFIGPEIPDWAVSVGGDQVEFTATLLLSLSGSLAVRAFMEQGATTDEFANITVASGAAELLLTVRGSFNNSSNFRGYIHAVDDLGNIYLDRSSSALDFKNVAGHFLLQISGTVSDTVSGWTVRYGDTVAG